MRYWWVNQNQTHRHEIGGGYLWSPKRNANGSRNPFYESMREVAPGDIVFSFVDTRIIAIGVAQSYCWESPKPAEFGSTGQNWENIGWKVLVAFTSLSNRIRPKDHIGMLRQLLSDKYSPLTPDGNGLQSIYLTEIPAAMAEVLGGIIGPEARSFVVAVPTSANLIQKNDDLDYWEHRLEQDVVEDESIPETDRQALIRARRGQGLFKQRVMQIERRCRITGARKPFTWWPATANRGVIRAMRNVSTARTACF